MVVAQIVPLISIYANDNEPAIRQNLVNQLNLLAKFCKSNGDAGYRLILDEILPVIAKLLEDAKPEVSNLTEYCDLSELLLMVDRFDKLLVGH